MNQYFNWGDKKSCSWRLCQVSNACSNRGILIQAMIKNFLTDYQHVTLR